jgi:hypothetical protein
MAPGKSKYKILPPKLPEPTLNVGECVEEMKRRVDHWDQGCVKDPTVRTGESSSSLLFLSYYPLINTDSALGL